MFTLAFLRHYFNIKVHFVRDVSQGKLGTEHAQSSTSSENKNLKRVIISSFWFPGFANGRTS